MESAATELAGDFMSAGRTVLLSYFVNTRYTDVQIVLRIR
jgi:hypothetical protein